jgi:hypothetical protein
MSDFLNDDPENAAGTVFRDVTLLALAGFVTIVMLLLPWLNPKGEQEETSTTPPGSVIVELFWGDDSDADVDLWVQAPEDAPVGYANMGGLYFNLLRDDLGKSKDSAPINYEVSYSRGISPGEHVANVHLYRAEPRAGPLEVTVAVNAVQPGQRARDLLFQKTITLDQEGIEMTVARFTIDRLGKLVPGSVNVLQKNLIDPNKRVSYRSSRRGN